VVHELAHHGLAYRLRPDAGSSARFTANSTSFRAGIGGGGGVGRRNCKALARLAAAVLERRQKLHELAGRSFGWLTGRLGAGDVTRAFAAELAANISLGPIDAKAIALARGLQVSGVVLCVMDQNDLTKCQCFIDLALSETKQRVHAILVAGMSDWAGLARFGPRTSSRSLKSCGDVVCAFVPVAGSAKRLDVRKGVAAALAPRDHVIRVEFFAGAALTGRDRRHLAPADDYHQQFVRPNERNSGPRPTATPTPGPGHVQCSPRAWRRCPARATTGAIELA
jgi:hypothetical protein